MCLYMCVCLYVCLCVCMCAPVRVRVCVGVVRITYCGGGGLGGNDH